LSLAAQDNNPSGVKMLIGAILKMAMDDGIQGKLDL